MSQAEVEFGFSPCPNDTFAFHALAHGLVKPRGMTIRPVLADVEELNQRAMLAELDLTKLSFHALAHVMESYVLMSAGAALGRGCGPVVVVRPGFEPRDLAAVEVAVPGRYTTAHLLLALHLGREPRVRPMRFDQIMPRVAAGEYDAGLIIHEGRFTYAGMGLKELLDLGRWWEEETGHPIPLGCIAGRRELGGERLAEVDMALAASVAHAWGRPGDSRSYVLAHAQEMAPEVVDQHIGLYVNRFTRGLGDEGMDAVRELMARGRGAGLLPRAGAPLTWAG